MEAQYGNSPHTGSVLPVSSDVCGFWFGTARAGWVCPSEALLKGLTARRLSLSCVPSLVSSNDPSPPFHGLLQQYQFKRPTGLISAGALPPSQEGRAITELANYMLELGLLFHPGLGTLHMLVKAWKNVSH